MDLLCPHICSTKAFKGKGALRRLARQAGLDLDRIEAEMQQLARASKLDAGFHYLALHRRRSGYGTPCSLRWRSAVHRHVPWQSVERDLLRLPVGLHEAYQELNRRATELNVVYRLMHGQRTKLEGLARARTTERAKGCSRTSRAPASDFQRTDESGALPCCRVLGERSAAARDWMNEA